MTILDPKAQRLLRETEETALTLVDDRGWENARAWAQHCANRESGGFGFWWKVVRAIEAMEAPMSNAEARRSARLATERR